MITPFPPRDLIDDIYAAHLRAQQPPPPTPARLFPRFGNMYCADCGFQYAPIKYCNCQPAAVETAPNDGPAAADLARRIDACRGK
jgi:hypothetical protein